MTNCSLTWPTHASLTVISSGTKPWPTFRLLWNLCQRRSLKTGKIRALKNPTNLVKELKSKSWIYSKSNPRPISLKYFLM